MIILFNGKENCKIQFYGFGQIMESEKNKLQVNIPVLFKYIRKMANLRRTNNFKYISVLLK